MVEGIYQVQYLERDIFGRGMKWRPRRVQQSMDVQGGFTEMAEAIKTAKEAAKMYRRVRLVRVIPAAGTVYGLWERPVVCVLASWRDGRRKGRVGLKRWHVERQQSQEGRRA